MRIEILIRQVRQQKGIPLFKLAKMTGISKGHLSRIENQETMPTVLTLERIALALKVDSKELYKVMP